jgi:hypothetical protein
MLSILRSNQCLQPFHYHSLMVRLDSTEKYVKVSSPDGLSFNASYINPHTKQILRDVEVNLPPDSTVHFMAAKELPGWYYVLTYSSYFGRYGCSCQRGKQYQQTHQECDHMRMLMEGAVA